MLSLVADYNMNQNYTPQLGVRFSNDLINVLGMDQQYSDFTISDYLIERVIGHRKIDLLANYPNHFIVCCDICDETVLSGSPVIILKYFPHETKDLTSFDIEFTNNYFVKLNSKSFDRIKIRIADLAGRTIESLSHHSTRLQLLFVNTNSL